MLKSSLHILTYGCQMNESDSEKIKTYYKSKNYKLVDSPESADLIIINMCSVRQSAVDRIYYKIKKFKNKQIILTGCITKKDRENFKKFNIKFKKFNLNKILPKKTFVPIMRGCNNFCSYCVVPYTRGREKFRPKKQIICEIKKLIKNHNKIILLGQNVNSYPNFVKLLQDITKLENNFKIGFLTNHPKDVSDKLIQEIANNAKIIRELHLPVQAGDNKILKTMNRKYTRQDYLKLVKKIKKAIPDIKLTTDVIVGFPGETKMAFENTCKLFKQVKFSKAYIARYSPRPGTASFNLKDNITPHKKKQREKILRHIIAQNP